MKAYRYMRAYGASRGTALRCVFRVPRRAVQRLFRIACLVAFLIAAYSATWMFFPESAMPPTPEYHGWVFEPQPSPPTPLAIEATAYCSCPICCGDWADGFTATGTRATEGRTLAADPAIFSAGTCLALGKLGHRIVEDTGSAILGWRVDVYFDSHQAALDFGRQFVSWGVC